MKFNPITGMLWTNKNEFLKVLDCPFGATQRDLIGDGPLAICQSCSRSVVSLEDLDDVAVAGIFAENREQCVSFSLDGPNLEVVFDVSRI